MQFREGLQHGWFEMLLTRNEYRSFYKNSDNDMHANIVRQWAKSLIILICPICPHWSESMWDKLGKHRHDDAAAATTGGRRTSSLAVHAPWPSSKPEDKMLTRRAKFLRDSLEQFRSQAGKAKKGWKVATILITESFPQWKVDTLEWMQTQYLGRKEDAFPKDFMKQLKAWTSIQNIKDKKLIKFTMQFASFTKKEVEEVGETAMETTLPFDQKSILVECLNYILSQLNLTELDIVSLDGNDDDNNNTTVIKDVPDRIKDNVLPGKPYLWLR